MIKFIHTGDLHLGLQFKNANFDGEKAQNRRLELWDTFEKIILKGIRDNVDFLFIAGDLFEEKYFTLNDIQRVRDNLAKAKDIKIIITAGNHDPLNESSLYSKIDWPEHIRIFSSNSIEKKEFVDKNTVVYGYSWDAGENIRDILKDFPKLDNEKINILILHGDVCSKDSVYLPLDKNLLHHLEFDYIGLGHIHKPIIFSDNMAYCGSPEPLDFGETGVHGIIEGRIDQDGSNIQLVPFSRRIFLEDAISIDETMGYVEIMDNIKGIDEKKHRKSNFYRVRLDGIRSRYVDLNLEDMVRELSDDFYHIELTDNTTIDYDLNTLEKENKDNIIGYFIREMMEKDLEDKLIKDALYIGLDVLMKG